MEREVTLMEMLEAREARVRQQDALRERYGLPVVSFTLNIAGPVKDSPLIRRAFQAGRKQLEAGLRAAKLSVPDRLERQVPTGCEALYAVDGTAREIKAVCVSIEDGSPLGRLFDMDVLDTDGRKLDRDEVGGGSRNCVVCGAPGKGCASRRTHTVEELQAATRRIMEEHFATADREKAAALVTCALLDEVCTTPKPGLVDRLWRAEAPCRDAGDILAECAGMVSSAVKEDFAILERKTARTAGQKLYVELGLTGVRGESAKGFPSISQAALPALKSALDAGLSRNDAGAVALLHLIARGIDTNLFSRGGPELAQTAAVQCKKLLEKTALPSMEELAELDRDFIRKNLSPGGCADLLAAAYFLQSWEADGWNEAPPLCRPVPTDRLRRFPRRFRQ